MYIVYNLHMICIQKLAEEFYAATKKLGDDEATLTAPGKPPKIVGKLMEGLLF